MALHGESYFQQVNRRLAAARFLLSKCENVSSTKIELQAYLDAALLQLYCAVFNYCNELLDNYRKPTLDNKNFNLHQIFSEVSSTFDNVHEFTEVKTWADTEGSLLNALCRLPHTLLSVDLNAPEIEAVKQQNIIVTVNEKTDVNLDSPQKASDFLEQFHSLIDRQRECQLEY